MKIALAYHLGDAAETMTLIRWINDLSESKFGELLLVADQSVPASRRQSIEVEARKSFIDVRTISIRAPNKWPDGSNAMFRAAANAMHGSPFLWMEPDAIPLRPGWLQEIAAEYKGGFMGQIYQCSNPALNPRIMSGIAVYPEDAIKRVPLLPNSPMAWEIEAAEIMCAHGTHTGLIKHFWGEPGLPPVFVSHTENRPRHGFTLNQIPPTACIWHRNKDGSLIRLLRREIFGVTAAPPIVPVFHVCGKDVGLALRHAAWLQKLGHVGGRAVVAFDRSMALNSIDSLRRSLAPVFESVETFTYPNPPIPGWPAACNWAWQQTALHMSLGENPWLWLEADAVILKPDWLERMQREYERGGKSVMGPRIPHSHHINGVAVYPADAPRRMPAAMKATNLAWDWVSRDEVAHDSHDAGKLFAHWWGLIDGRIDTNAGPAPAGITPQQFDAWINPEAVLVHRIKDDSVIRILESRYESRTNREAGGGLERDSGVLVLSAGNPAST